MGPGTCLLPRSGRLREVAVLVAIAVMILAGCTERTSTDTGGARDGLPSSIDEELVLSDAPAEVHAMCEEAARQLGFAVPCPTKVPTRGGEPVVCKLPCGKLSAGGHPLFFMEFVGFDAPTGINSRDHIIIEGRSLDEAPQEPCVEGRRVADLDAPPATVFDCPEAPSLAAANHIAHGEGAQIGHLLASWEVDDIRYAVSIHGGDSNAAREALRQLRSYIALVAPPDDATGGA
jgi:hypothetical protein